MNSDKAGNENVSAGWLPPGLLQGRSEYCRDALFEFQDGCRRKVI